MQRFHVKKGDEVVVLSGTERGKRGKIIEVLRGKQRVIVESAKIVKRHTKKQRNPNAPQSGIIEREGTIHISNMMLAATFNARASKRGVTAPAETPGQA